MNNPFIDIRLQLRYISEISGWGVFTTKNIDANIDIEISPVLVYPKKLMDTALWCCQAEGFQNKDFKLDQYTLRWNNDCAVPLGWTGLYNHKDLPNCIFKADYKNNLLHIQTIKPIFAEEQLFVSYGEHWFIQKGYVSKYDF